jgi:SPP1 gp7 family putative phage head morphogenesis protein
MADLLDDILLRDTVARAILVERVTVGEARKILRMLDEDVFPALEDRAAAQLTRIKVRGHDVSARRYKHLRAMLTELGQLQADLVKKVGAVNAEDAAEFAVAEAEWQARSLSRSAPSIVATVPAPSLARAVVRERPFDGALLRAHWRDLSARTKRRIDSAITEGVTVGDSADQIVRRLVGTRAGRYRDGVWGTTRREADALVRTALAHTSAAAREVTYEENPSIIRGVEWVSTLDSAVCQICTALDGRLFRVGEGPRPPAHIRCRCTTTPKTPTFGQLGIDRDERDRIRAARDPDTGEVGTSTRRADEWILSLPAARQDEILGPGAAKILRRGNVPIERFIKKDLLPLTVRELRELDAQLEGVANPRKPLLSGEYRPPAK